MPSSKILVVSGVGRCGSSMTMQQLIKAGVKPTGAAEDPLWEDGRVADLMAGYGDWLDDCVGKVIKILNPHILVPPPRDDYVWIWLDRNKSHQLASQHKTSAWMRRHRQNFSIEEWTRKGLGVIKRVGGPLLKLRYETVVRHPMPQSVILAGFVRKHTGHDLDPKRLAAEVRHRSPKNHNWMAEGDFV